MAALDDFHRITQAGVGQRAEFIERRLCVINLKDVAQANAHLLRAKIFTQPE